MTDEEFAGWRLGIVGEEVFKYLEKRRLFAAERVAEIGLSNDPDYVAMQTARNTGIIIGLNELIELVHSDFSEETT